MNVAIFDSIPLFRDALSEQVRRAGGMRLLGATASLSVAADPRVQRDIDVIVLDAVLDPYSHFANFVTASQPHVAILAVVREPLYNAAYVQTALSSGVRGMIPRTSTSDEMLGAMHKVLGGDRYLHPALARIAEHAAETCGARGVELTRREHEVLLLIAEGLQSKAIATALFISAETVRTHVKNICKKLAARDRAHAVATAFHVGLLQPSRSSRASVPNGRAMLGSVGSRVAV
ncbi:response regulator transcription factor [Actinocrispum wychmicini]|uniref:response regulator transcription factor n=1 Tax=Actinocrispum wychmicini TaxID=1213861 RepID=UPI001FB666BF|nr:response regulator transcription factor [Actinocrispum wychmicini]